MTGQLTNLFMAILYVWAVAGTAGMFLSMPMALGLGTSIGVILGLAWPRNPLSKAVVALLDPVGVVLPFLALRQMAGWIGMEIRPFHSTELVLFLIVYILFLAAATGKLRFDPYRLGYAPLPSGVVALGLCVIGAIQASLFLPLLAVLAQAQWVFRAGSSNYFDHILHAVLVPVVLIELAGRIFGG